MSAIAYQPRSFHPPMTAAERQRRCRENGKGRHRGPRITKAQFLRYQQAQALAAAAPAARAQHAAQSSTEAIVAAPSESQATVTPVPSTPATRPAQAEACRPSGTVGLPHNFPRSDDLGYILSPRRGYAPFTAAIA
jgi:hypothetical protein